MKPLRRKFDPIQQYVSLSFGDHAINYYSAVAMHICSRGALRHLSDFKRALVVGLLVLAEQPTYRQDIDIYTHE